VRCGAGVGDEELDAVAARRALRPTVGRISTRAGVGLVDREQVADDREQPRSLEPVRSRPSIVRR
jgi:hypothetical protein